MPTESQLTLRVGGEVSRGSLAHLLEKSRFYVDHLRFSMREKKIKERKEKREEKRQKEKRENKRERRGEEGREKRKKEGSLPSGIL